MHLTEQEQQELARLLETGKPLPEKYRSMLLGKYRDGSSAVQDVGMNGNRAAAFTGTGGKVESRTRARIPVRIPKEGIRTAETEAEMRRAAYHEAGHAVLNLMFGLPFETVSLKMEEKLAYQIENGQKVAVMLRYTIGIAFSEERLISVNKALMSGILDIREAITLMGGAVAELIFLGKFDEEVRIGAREDFQAIACCCRAAMSGSDRPEDWTVFAEMESQMISAITVAASHLLQDNWTSVEAIAELLIKKKELGHAEVSSIAEAKGLKKRG